MEPTSKKLLNRVRDATSSEISLLSSTHRGAHPHQRHVHVGSALTVHAQAMFEALNWERQLYAAGTPPANRTAAGDPRFQQLPPVVPRLGCTGGLRRGEGLRRASIYGRVKL